MPMTDIKKTGTCFCIQVAKLPLPEIIMTEENSPK